LAARNLPVGTTALRLTRLDQYAENTYGDSPANTVSFNIPLSTGTNGLYLIPANETTSPTDAYGYAEYQWFAQPVNANGQGTSQATCFYYGFISQLIPQSWIVPPYFDGRAQLKQNLIFLLRAATVDFPFYYQDYYQYRNGSYQETITNSAAYAYSAFNSPYPIDGLYILSVFDVFSPFQNNYLYRNFVYSLTDVDSGGHISTGVSGNYSDSHEGGLVLLDPPLGYQFQPPTTSGTAIGALLATNQTQWLCSYPLDSPEMYYDPATDSMVSYGYLEEIGVTPSADAGWNQWETMAANVRNVYGLPFLSAKIAWGNTSDATYTLSAGSQVENVDGYFYPQTAQPQFQTVEYDFWNSSPLPGSSSFSTSQTSDLLIAGVNSSIGVNGYAKLALLNGYSGVYGYLGQYFDQAYQIDTNGNVTANTTGVLSPYGSFFATEPGPVALVTMPDPDTGARGTCTVYCASLALDKNHDGKMDLSWNGPDSTSPSSPYTHWVNNNYDRVRFDSDDNTNYEDDVQTGGCPDATNTPTSDYDYKDATGARAIPTKRDLEDFARLWVCGVTSNLLAALPAGSTVTLSWGDVGNPNPNNPTIDLFLAADTDGGIGYLTNETVAAEQTNNVQCPNVARLGPGRSLTLNSWQFANGWAGNYFIWCGVAPGSGQLTLTIADGNNNPLAQSSVYIQIVDIKQMYERWTVGDSPTNAPTITPALVSDFLPVGVSGFQYAAPLNTNTPYILFVHGWNLEPWEKDRYAETAFKRLYWQGYQGRFGEFRWPTDFGFTGKWSQFATNLTEKDNFDNSEYQAWQSAPGLLNLLTSLNTEYPSHVYMLAHSMGNVVAGEALRLAGTSRLVNTYVASQAAVSAHTYDGNTNDVPNYSFYYPPWSLQADTPNIYGNWFAGNNGSGAGRVISFYNMHDFALQRSVWQLDELLKPDQLVSENGSIWDYKYGGSVNDPPPWNNFYKQNSVTYAITNFDIVGSLLNRYEVMGYDAQSWTTALGATPGVHNVAANTDLTTLWPSPDPLGNNYASHFYHSAEFRGDSVWQWGYWNTLLFSPTAGFNISSP
jgi:hypothetical protein